VNEMLCRTDPMKPHILYCLLGAAMFSGCIWGRIERSELLTESNASFLKGEDVTVTLKDSTVREATILEITKDSLALRSKSWNQNLALANVNDIPVGGSVAGRLGGGMIGGLIDAQFCTRTKC